MQMASGGKSDRVTVRRQLVRYMHVSTWGVIACLAAHAYGQDCPPAANDCFTGTSEPGCNDPACCALVCAQDEFCCQTAWDNICAFEAGELCTGCGDPDTGSCLEAHRAPYCDNVHCCQLVCAIDATCCDTVWDRSCADVAAEICIDDVSCPESDHNCFTVGGPGCGDPSCCESVCNEDPFCCLVEWDDICSTEAFLSPACDGCGDPAAGDCWNAHAVPYCSNRDCCNVVCTVDETCCSSGWDELCVSLAVELCGLCGNPEAGSCFSAHATGGCNDAECCAKVCAFDNFCCDVEWDFVCKGFAAQMCEPCPSADLDGDCKVTGSDLGLLLAAWGSANADADLNNDDTVDGADLGLLLAGWTG